MVFVPSIDSISRAFSAPSSESSTQTCVGSATRCSTCFSGSLPRWIEIGPRPAIRRAQAKTRLGPLDDADQRPRRPAEPAYGPAEIIAVGAARKPRKHPLARRKGLKDLVPEDAPAGFTPIPVSRIGPGGLDDSK